MDNTEFVNSLFQTLLFRQPTAQEQQELSNRLDNGLMTRQGLVEMAFDLPLTKTYPYQVSAIYQAVFNQLPTDEQLAIWGGLHLQGLSLAQMAQQMLSSSTAKTAFPDLSNTNAVFNQLSQHVLGRDLQTPELTYVADALTAGQTPGQLIELLISLPEATTKNQNLLIKNMLWQAVTLTQPTLDQLNSLPDNSADYAVQLIQLPDSEQNVADYWESAGTLYANVEWTLPIIVDLSTNQLTAEGLTIPLTTGSINSASSVDFSRLVSSPDSEPPADAFPVSIKGDAQNNTIIGSQVGNKIESAAGNDRIVLANGIDQVKFAVDANSNGFDVIDSFTLGQDQLDFALFLNKNIGSVNLRSAMSTETESIYWSSGDLLVVQGDNLTTNREIAGLFGESRVFSNPLGPSKAVVLSTNVTGDTYVWFIENTQDNQVSSIEVKNVAILTDVNNLLDQVNITSLKASMQISQSPGQLYYNRSFLTESSNNDGTIATNLLITLQGDTFTGTVGQSIGLINNLPAGLKANLIKLNETQAQLSITGKANNHASANSIQDLTIRFSEEDFTSGNLALNAVKTDLSMLFMDVNLTESGGNLNVSGILPSNLLIDLSNDQVTLGTALVQPLFGNLANADTVNLAAITNTNFTVKVIGDTMGENFIAAPIGGSLQGKAGNDNFLLGSGTDTLVFESTAMTNNLDTIFNFDLGIGGDKLDFTAFLNKSGFIANVVKQGSNANQAWTNGSIIMVQGDFTPPSTSSSAAKQEISSLFTGDLAAPTVQAKTVLITANLTGDASVWYITNQSNSDINAISSSEIEHVATLVGINNLSLVPMVVSNFV